MELPRSLDDLGHALDASLDGDALLERARELVRVPSENPPGDERAVAAAVSPHLKAMAAR